MKHFQHNFPASEANCWHRNRQEQDRPYSCSGADETCPNSAGDAPSSKQRLLSNGYDFTHFESYFAEHRKMKQEEERYVLRKRMKQRTSSSKDDFAGTSPDCPDNDTDIADYPEGLYIIPLSLWCLYHVIIAIYYHYDNHAA